MSFSESKCWQPCTTDEDCQACAIAYSCYETGSSCGSDNKEGTNHYYCGLSEFHQFECMQSTCGYHKIASYTFSLSLFTRSNFLSIFYFHRLVWCRLQVYQAVSERRSQCCRWSRRIRMSRGRNLLCWWVYNIFKSFQFSHLIYVLFPKYQISPVIQMRLLFLFQLYLLLLRHHLTSFAVVHLRMHKISAGSRVHEDNQIVAWD